MNKITAILFLLLFAILIQAVVTNPKYLGQSFSLITNVYASDDEGGDGGKEDDSANEDENDQDDANDEGEEGGEEIPPEEIFPEVEPEAEPDNRSCGPGEVEISRTPESLACEPAAPTEPEPDNRRCGEGEVERARTPEILSCEPDNRSCGPGEVEISRTPESLSCADTRLCDPGTVETSRTPESLSCADTRLCDPGTVETSRTPESLSCVKPFVPPQQSAGTCRDGSLIPLNGVCPGGTTPGPLSSTCPDDSKISGLGLRPSSICNFTVNQIYNGSSGTSANTTLTIKKLLYNTKQLIPGSYYSLTPNPYNPSPSSCLIVHDNDDKYDLNMTEGIVLLKKLPYLSYNIVETSNQVTCGKENILHEAQISLNEKLPRPVVNIVENTDLARPLSDEIIPNQYIVMLNDTAMLSEGSKSVSTDTESVADEFVSKGARLIHVFKNVFNGFSLYISNNGLLNQLMNDPRIAAIEQDKFGHVALASSTSASSAAPISTSSPSAPSTTADQFSTTQQITPIGIQRILAKNAGHSVNSTAIATSVVTGLRPNLNMDFENTIDTTHTVTKNGRDVNVDIAVVDSGISKSHPELNVYRDVSFVNETTSGDDDDGHGSHVAGTAAAKDNSFGVVGVAPGARLWALKVCYDNRCPVSDQIKAMDYIIQHADEIDVVNISLESPRSKLLDRAVNKVVSEGGITVVAAAGNEARDTKFNSPARSPDVIAVSAIADSDGKCGGLGRTTIGGADDHFANFSNFGSDVDLAAPGVDIISTYNKGDYGLESGTSMAAPHVTGYAALYKADNPLATPSEVKSALLQTAATSTTSCNGANYGYFIDDVDNFKEPLLFVNQAK